MSVRNLARARAPTATSDPSGTPHVLARFRALRGRALDTAFVQHEITDHEHDIVGAQKIEAAVHGAPFTTGRE